MFLKESGLLERVSGCIIEPSEWTCKSSTAAGVAYNCIDYFSLPVALLPYVISCNVSFDANLKSHRPAILRLRTRKHRIKQRVIFIPKLFGKQLPVGPFPEPPKEWDGFCSVFASGFACQDVVSYAYEQFMGIAENELLGMYQIPEDEQDDYTGRGVGPKFLGVDPVRKNNVDRPKACATSRQSGWFADRLREVVHLRSAARDGAHRQASQILWELRRLNGPITSTDLWKEFSSLLVSHGDDDVVLEGLAGVFSNLADKLASMFAYQRRNAFKEWAIRACKGSAGEGHRFCKGPIGFVGDKGTPDGPLGPQAMADDLLRTWLTDNWNIVDGTCDLSDIGYDKWEMPVLQIPQVRKVAGTFAWKSGLGCDNFHPRWILCRIAQYVPS